MVWGTGRALGGRDASPGSAQRLVRLQNGLEVALGERAGHIYGRNTNPTAAALEEKVRDLEGAEAATSFASGMAAISNTLFTLLSPGDRVVLIKDTYGGTNKLFVEFLPRFQIAVSLCDTTDHETIEAVIAEGCKLLYLETPTNPTIKIIDGLRGDVAAERQHWGRSPRSRLRGNLRWCWRCAIWRRPVC